MPYLYPWTLLFEQWRANEVFKSRSKKISFDSAQANYFQGAISDQLIFSYLFAHCSYVAFHQIIYPSFPNRCLLLSMSNVLRKVHGKQTEAKDTAWLKWASLIWGSKLTDIKSNYANKVSKTLRWGSLATVNSSFHWCINSCATYEVLWGLLHHFTSLSSIRNHHYHCYCHHHHIIITKQQKLTFI